MALASSKDGINTNIIPSTSKLTPTRTATNKGCAIENAAKKTVIIPKINVNMEPIFANAPGLENMPAIPINISINAIK